MSHTLVASSIHLSLLSYLLAVVCWVFGKRGLRYQLLWTSGCGFLWLHALSAFHFYHNWSHAHAVELTAEETQAIMGVSFGEGIWFSYLLLVIWLADVVGLWVGLGDSRAWRTSHCVVQGYVFFILFNGTVVFEQGPVRWAGVVGTIWIVWLGLRFRHAADLGTNPG